MAGLFCAACRPSFQTVHHYYSSTEHIPSWLCRGRLGLDQIGEQVHVICCVFILLVLGLMAVIVLSSAVGGGGMCWIFTRPYFPVPINDASVQDGWDN